MSSIFSLRYFFKESTQRMKIDVRRHSQNLHNSLKDTATASLSTDTILKNAEVEHHSKFSADWWNRMGPMKALHSFNIIRVPFIRDGLIARGNVSRDLLNTTNVLENQQILEVGCGGGILSEQIGRLGATVKGIDLSKELIEVARKHLAESHLSNFSASKRISELISYEVVSIEEHSQHYANFYDAVILSEVIEHVDDKAAFFNFCVQCLKPGGSLFITTINQTMAMWLGGVVFAEYLLNLVPRGTHHWEKMISPLNIQRLLDTMNCTTVIVNGCIYEFWNNQWRWINSTNMCYAVQAIKTN